MTRPCYSDVVGLTPVVRELAAAVRQGHPVLLQGHAGCGSTMLAARVVTLLPALDGPARDLVEAIYTAIPMDPPKHRPFRAPHHTVSYAGLINPYGEVDLARYGVLYFDEALEFRRSIMEEMRHYLRSGIDDRSTPLAVASRTLCPCGRQAYQEHDGRLRLRHRGCQCTIDEMERWNLRTEIVAAQLGIKTRLTVPMLTTEQRASAEPCPTSDELRAE